MRASSLFLLSFGFLSFVSYALATPIGALGPFFGSESNPPDQPSQLDQPDQSYQPDLPDQPVQANQPDQSYPDSSPAEKLVLAHHMVGNTYVYDVGDWESDIKLAHDTGIDAFVLNIGSDAWQFDQVQNAFTAAAKYPGFKLCISFDMSSISCSVPGDTRYLQKFMNAFLGDPKYLLFQGKPLVTAFSGQECTFGADTPNQGWLNTIKPEGARPVHFVPSFFFMDPASLQEWPSIDGACNWNASWPKGDNPIEFDADNDWIQNLGGRTYMAGISPWFFTHYSPQTYNKNFIYQFDEWMFTRRWELLIANRDRVPLAQIITWNDFGESHYTGRLLSHSSQPDSEAWVNGFDHTGWLYLFRYYLQAFKTGVYPEIEQDRIILWMRRFPALASTPDPVGPPDHCEWVHDVLWAVFMLCEPADVVLRCGDNVQTTTNVPAGLAKVKLPLEATCKVSASIVRGDGSGMDFAPERMEFTTEQQKTYNFNAFVAASP
ncbi:glycoside hydrolase family 71 protein [Mycena maculata]|uniref:Glycoside hydrolase family 71 protein n=1 Tax=Mycena maculata TaxID=230809 RepID=A0AAD7MJC4_9AGAR|nr:glycoside hydrolase family 71 protein [Mycena maculata]